MEIFPAIDIKEGRCVRLMQGDMRRETVFSGDPVSQAKKWEQAGARMIHIVDLDGAVEGRPRNAELIAAMCKAVKCGVQLGGGIRSRKIAEEYFSAGIRRVVLGTLLIKDFTLAEGITRAHPGKVMAGIDSRNGKVAGDGWTEVSSMPATELAARIADWPLAGIIFTDIARDGMMQGANLDEIRKMAAATNHPLIASGGISGIRDLEELSTVAGVAGAIIGKALYTGAIDLDRAIREFQGE